MLVILYIAHICACFWYYVGVEFQLFPPPNGYAQCADVVALVAPATDHQKCADPSTVCAAMVAPCCVCESGDAVSERFPTPLPVRIHTVDIWRISQGKGGHGNNVPGRPCIYMGRPCIYTLCILSQEGVPVRR